MGWLTSRYMRLRPRLKQCAAAISACFLVLWLTYHALSLGDSCQGPRVQSQLCDAFSRGIVAGKFCHELCVKKSVHLSSCEPATDHDPLVFQAVLPPKKGSSKSSSGSSGGGSSSSSAPVVDRVLIKLPSSHRYSPSMNLSLSAYSEPVKGVSLVAFKGTLHAYLVAQLGQKAVTPANVILLRDRLLDAADADKDGKVSLAEAKSIWALLQSHDFFVTLLFQDSDQIPRLRGFCGAAFVVDDVPVKRLYRPPAASVAGGPNAASESSSSSSSSSFSFSPLDLLFPQRHFWGLPSWPDRAKVGVGVLEFISHIHAHDYAGSFFLCGTDASNVGYSVKHDAKFHALTGLLSKEMLARLMTSRGCRRSAEDCRLSAHCTTMCDESAGKCTAELARPNLHLGCRILRDYLLYDAPEDLRGELKRLFAKCDVLERKVTRSTWRRSCCSMKSKVCCGNELATQPMCNETRLQV